MADLKTTYLGIEINNPIIVSSSGLTDSIEKLIDIEEAGAGAIVLKSLFEEQIKNKANVLMNEESYGNYPESYDYIKHYIKSHDIEKYINLIKEAKQKLNIPIIASINCASSEGWIEFAKKIEEAGADALEVNVFLLPDSNNRTSESYEEVYYEIARNLNAGISIPFSLKIGSSFTNIIGLADKLRVFGASGLVLFNRFFEPDIDIESMSIVSANRLSYPSEITKSLRWIGVLSDETKEFDIAASTGVHDGEAAIKLLLAGAQAIQICSVIYAEGLEIIDEIKDDIISWMVDKNYKKIEDFRYKLNAKSVGANSLYSRSQFMKYYSDAKEITY